jgi:hypothetical protein
VSPDRTTTYELRHFLPVRSAPIAAHLRLAGHAVLHIRHDHRLGRDVFLFDAATAQRDFDRFMHELDALRADAERATKSAGERR